MSTSPSNFRALVTLTPRRRVLILTVAFLGWLCAGMHMAITQQAGQPAAIDLLSRSGELDIPRFKDLNESSQAGDKLSADERQQLSEWKALIARWFAWYQCAFLFGAATGGWVFGRLGDQIGRTKGMALSIVMYSVFAGAAWFTQTPEQLLVVWYLACTGVGGMWPNGVAVVAETWAEISRPVAAGVIGTAANVGLFLMSSIAANVPITPEEWRWVMMVGAAPLALGLFALVAVPESPRWLAARAEDAAAGAPSTSLGEVFRHPLLGVTVMATVLATVPLIGGWGSANWMSPWADTYAPEGHQPDPFLKARIGQARALTGIVGSLLGGWIASVIGRRRTYFLVSLSALAIAQYTFWFLVPTDETFLIWVAALGFVSGIYFGWLPLFLPELFPTRVRSTGSGVGFNFGRIVTAVTVFAAGALTTYFAGDYARIGQVTSLVFAIGMVAIWFAPDTGQNELKH